MSAAWRSGESSAASAAASPPWAQKLELSASGFRETSVACAPSAAASSATCRPAAPPPTTTTSASLVPTTSGVRYPQAQHPRPLALYYSHPSSHRHDTGPHPENAGRLVAIEGALERAGWPGLERREAPAATREQILRVHDEAHVDAIEALLRRGRRHGRHGHGREPGLVRGRACTRPAAPQPRSSRCSAATPGPRSAACARRATTPSATGRWASACSTTPPSPPPTRSPPAAPSGCWCSTGTSITATAPSAIFAASPEVLYASIHQSPLYPGTGAAEYAGEGPGEGYTVNLPVPAGSDSETFLALVEHVVVPIARAYEPGLIVISAGYDAHRDDPLASCAVDTEAYGEMTAAVRDLAAELRRPAARLPRGRLLANRPRRLGARDGRRHRRGRCSRVRARRRPPSPTAPACARPGRCRPPRGSSRTLTVPETANVRVGARWL